MTDTAAGGVAILPGGSEGEWGAGVKLAPHMLLGGLRSARGGSAPGRSVQRLAPPRPAQAWALSS